MYKKTSVNGISKLKHRAIMEEALGRELLTTEIVHHINRDPTDNRLENLQVLSHKEHIAIHREDIIHSTLARMKKRMANRKEEEMVRPRTILERTESFINSEGFIKESPVDKVYIPKIL